MLTLEDTFQLSRNNWVPDRQKLCTLDLAQVSGEHERKMATGELLVGRTTEIQAAYEQFRADLGTSEITIQEHLLGRFAAMAAQFGSRVLPRAVLSADDFPANMRDSGRPVNHYNLWIAFTDEGKSLDFTAGELALSRLIKRNTERETKCFQRVQSVPPTQDFPYYHCHEFTLSTLPNNSPVVIA